MPLRGGRTLLCRPLAPLPRNRFKRNLNGVAYTRVPRENEFPRDKGDVIGRRAGEQKVACSFEQLNFATRSVAIKRNRQAASISSFKIAHLSKITGSARVYKVQVDKKGFLFSLLFIRIDKDSRFVVSAVLLFSKLHEQKIHERINNLDGLSTKVCKIEAFRFARPARRVIRRYLR